MSFFTLHHMSVFPRSHISGPVVYLYPDTSSEILSPYRNCDFMCFLKRRFAEIFFFLHIPFFVCNEETDPADPRCHIFCRHRQSHLPVRKQISQIPVIYRVQKSGRFRTPGQADLWFCQIHRIFHRDIFRSVARQVFTSCRDLIVRFRQKRKMPCKSFFIHPCGIRVFQEFAQSMLLYLSAPAVRRLCSFQDIQQLPAAHMLVFHLYF